MKQIYCLYGDDEYSLKQAVQKLVAGAPCQRIKHQTDEKLDETLKTAIAAIRQYTLTDHSWVWLEDTTALQPGKVKKGLQEQFEATLAALRTDKHVLITCEKKPNGTLRLTRWLQANATVKALELTPSWNTKQLLQETAQVARDHGVVLSPDGINALVEAVGNQTRERVQALEKLWLLQTSTQKPLTANQVETVVYNSASSSLRLARQIRERNPAAALETLNLLIEQNQHPLETLQSLVTQFRTWLWVKALLAERQSDQAIAQAVGFGNPGRLYYLKQELQDWGTDPLTQALSLLLEAEWQIKQGQNGKDTLKRLIFQFATAE